MKTNLAYRSLRIPQINKQIVTFQVEVYNIPSMQVFHTKSNIHGY